MHRYLKFDEKIINELKNFQIKLSGKICLEDHFEKVEKVAGVDIAYKNNRAYVAMVIIDSELKVRNVYTLKTKVHFPYIPGFLAFRELKPIGLIVRRHLNEFDILFVNGHGIAHPRKLGIASHVGVLFKIPTIGVAKGLLFGRIGRKLYDNIYEIIHGNEILGYLVEINGKRFYISPGNFISLKSCLEIFLRFSSKNPIELAHVYANAFKKGYKTLI